MKRGPSKGYKHAYTVYGPRLTSDSYIKELADRLNTLESQIGGNPQNIDYDIPLGLRDQNIENVQTPTARAYTRKRTHSMSEGPQDPYGPAHRPNMGWSGQETIQTDQHSLNGANSLPLNINEAVRKAYVMF
jgi:hypothetical protein